jgi:NAD(P)-dependent dehydrogenase (short-subunit alcohol dehydrogenase family)
MGLLDGRVAVITGAGSGIGRAAAEALAKEGAAVFATDIDEGGLEVTAATFRCRRATLKHWFRMSPTRLLWDTVMDEAEAKLGTPSILVNNAGIAIGGAIPEFSLDDWKTQMSVNVDSVFLGTRAAIRKMQETGGSIINISSVAGCAAQRGSALIARPKGAVRLFTKAAAVECARAGWPIRVNSVHPGYHRYAHLAEIDHPFRRRHAHYSGHSCRCECVGCRHPGCSGVADGTTRTPGRDCGLIVYLASDKSSYINGQEHVVDGAMTAAADLPNSQL